MASENITFFDPETEVSIELNLSPEDALRAQTDMVFATTLMKAALKERNSWTVNDQSSPPRQESSTDCTEAEPEDGGALYRWTTECVKLLLDTYKSLERKFSSGKQPQKKIWEEVSQILKTNGYNISGPQCAAKLRSLKKTYKSVKDYNKTSGNDKRTWQFYNLMDEIFAKKAWSEPVATASSSGTCTKNSNIDSGCEHDSTVSKVSISKQSVPVLLAKRLRQKEEHEELKAKRHKDRLEMDEKFLNVLEKIANKK